MDANWLPSIISIVVVIVGGFITYSATIRIEEQKRQFELKKEVYFGVLNAINEYRGKRADFDNTCFVNYSEQNEAITEMEESLVSHKMKIQICANEDIYRIFSDLLSKVSTKNYQDFNDTVNKRLIPAMKDDLMKSKKSWWQFWM